MKKLMMVVLVLLFSGIFGQVFAQAKVRFIDSREIYSKYPEAVELQKKLDQLFQQYDKEYNDMVAQLQKDGQDLENQRLLLSPEKKAEKEQALQELYNRIEQYKIEKIGPQGEIYVKRDELSKPINDKINQVIEQISLKEGYDIVWDVVTVGLLYYNETLNITDTVLEELQKIK